MLLFYLWWYICTLLLIWAFYIIARIHVLKFKSFSNDITPVTNFLLVFLLVCSVTGFVLIFFIDSGISPNTIHVDTIKIDKKQEKPQDLKNQILWSEDY